MQLATSRCRGRRPALALQRGVYLHPKHNMFLSVAHRPQDIDQALQQTQQAAPGFTQGKLELHYLPGYAPDLNPDSSSAVMQPLYQSRWQAQP